MGRKRHVVVDTAGLLLGVLITAANVSDQAGARELLKEVCLRFGWLRHIWADAGYLGQKLLAAVQQLIPNRGLRNPDCQAQRPASDTPSKSCPAGVKLQTELEKSGR